MATAKIEFVNGAQTVTSTKTVSAGDIVRLIDAVRAIDGLGAGATNAQVLDHLSTKTFKLWIQMVKEYEQRIASKTAIDAVAPIGIS